MSRICHAGIQFKDGVAQHRMPLINLITSTNHPRKTYHRQLQKPPRSPQSYCPLTLFSYSEVVKKLENF